MKGIETIPAMVATPFFGFGIVFFALFTDKRIVAVDRVVWGLSFHLIYGIIAR